MILSRLISLRNKIPIACKRLKGFLKLRLKKPLFIRALQFHGSKYEPRKKQRSKITLQFHGSKYEPRKKQRSKIISILGCLKSSRDMDRVVELKSFSDIGYSIKEPFPSPLTPAYLNLSATNTMEVSGQQELEDACRSFENYLAEMVVEEGRTRDLMDVEELLFCWKSLKCPIFVDLVCKFYGELCKDLFSNASQDDKSISKRLLN